MKIQKLPQQVRSKLQSGLVVTDAVQCVLELVYNSLDAKATGVAVRVDLKTYQIRVIDNGKGIGRDDLEFVGERFMTSKYHPSSDTETFSTYGFKGQALSSLQEVSKSLTIETKYEDGGPTFVKVFKNNKALPIVDTDSSRNGTGTIVTIDDFLYSMPIRRKRIREVFDMEEIKTQLHYLAIIHYNVSFTLRNESKGLILLQTPQTSSVLESITNIYGKTVAKSLKALYYEEKKFEITGFISQKPQTQNNVQIIYINKRVITKGVIHKFINSLVKEYSGKGNLLSDESTNHMLKNVTSCHNVFILQIKCPHSYYELFTNLRKRTVEFKNWKVTLKCIHRAVKRTFKTDLNLDSSSNIQNRNENESENKAKRKVFGTSLLINAVKGVPAKRDFNVKLDENSNEKNNTKVNDTKEKSDLLPMKSNEDICNNRYMIDSLKTGIIQNEFTNDTLESPIPKKVSKKSYEMKFKKASFNKSFFEFYEWLKVKFQTDTNAFNLYNDFLQFKKGLNPSQDCIEFKSPVVGGKLKRKYPPKQKRAAKKQKTPSEKPPTLDKEIAIFIQEQSKMFPDQHLRMKKAVQFTTETTGFSKNFNLDLEFINKNLNYEENSKELFKKSEGVGVGRRPKKLNKDLPSLSSSEVQFTNAIKFRNLSDGFCQSFDTCTEVLLEKSFSGSNTWSSHYENFMPRNSDLCNQQQNAENFVPYVETYKTETLQKNKDLEFNCSNACEEGWCMVKKTNKAKELKDIEIQVNMLVLPAEKASCMIQTSQEICESSNSKNSFMLNPECDKTVTEKVQKAQVIVSEKDLLEEVPNPDFWNSSTYMQSENKVDHSELAVNDMISKKLSNDFENYKNSESSEFVCGQNSHASTKLESASKDTQTLAVLWTDSLTEMGGPIEPDKVGDTNLNSDHTQLTSLPNTLPIQDIAGQIESNFCVTERHNFVPKGLSPRFINIKRTKISSLSSSEKYKIKTTVDDKQNDLLATVKWQDVSTDNCLKPTIPNDIFFEMRQKAREVFMNYENPVLTAKLSCCAVKVHNLLHSFVFTKELLSDIEVLGQLDKKFIVTKMKISAPKEMELISLFDQHAADERIKLEELIIENITSEGKFVFTSVTPPIECTLGESCVRVFADSKEKMLNFGFRADVLDESTISITEAPTFLLKKHENIVKNKKETTLSDIIKTVIINIVQELKETRGAVSEIPKGMHNAFCLEACHKAIKFNKKLSLESMTKIIYKLQNCKLPFQCAHGRPSVIPIIDLQDFKPTMEEENIDHQKFKKFFNNKKEY